MFLHLLQRAQVTQLLDDGLTSATYHPDPHASAAPPPALQGDHSWTEVFWLLVRNQCSARNRTASSSCSKPEQQQRDGWDFSLVTPVDLQQETHPPDSHQDRWPLTSVRGVLSNQLLCSCGETRKQRLEGSPEGSSHLTPQPSSLVPFNLDSNSLVQHSFKPITVQTRVLTDTEHT